MKIERKKKKKTGKKEKVAAHVKMDRNRRTGLYRIDLGPWGGFVFLLFLEGSVGFSLLSFFLFSSIGWLGVAKNIGWAIVSMRAEVGTAPRHDQQCLRIS